MRRPWVGVTILMVGWLGTAPAHTEEPPASRLLIDQLARTYSTPGELVRFLKDTITFATDQELFGVPDYWQTPEEFLARRAGDCEDYALLAQAVLERQGVEAHVVSLFGQDGYAHTFCVFREAGRYGVINQDRVRYYRSRSLEGVAGQVYRGWTYAAFSERYGIRGRATRLIANPHPASNLLSADPLFSFP